MAQGNIRRCPATNIDCCSINISGTGAYISLTIFPVSITVLENANWFKEKVRKWKFNRCDRVMKNQFLNRKLIFCYTLFFRIDRTHS